MASIAIHPYSNEDSSIHIDADSRPIPYILTFSNLSYSVKIRPTLTFRSILRPASGDDFFKPHTKTLLNDVSGEARDGEIMAVLGASGAGKSTLIDALANRIAKGSLKGSVTLNGEKLESRVLKVMSAYVMQDDLLFPMLTVEETLMFAAELRLPRTLSESKKRARVDRLIDQLGLRNAANTVIGDEGHRGVSGGERRRVSIGTEIVHDPIMLFLDEPTSGLDSTSAFMVVKVLQRIAQRGSIVIMSVHQPSWRILGLLDRLIFLSRGQTVFSGPPSDLPPFFSGFGHPIPENENWSEFALDLIQELETSPGGTKSLIEFSRQWINKHYSRTEIIENPSLDISASTVPPRFANPMWKEIAVLSRRAMTNSRRMPEQFGVRLGAISVTGFILATMFYHLDESPSGIKERLGFFAFGVSTIFYTCADALSEFLSERYIFMRETSYNTYRRTSYVLSHTITPLPGLILLSLVFSTITFSTIGLSGGLSGFLFYFSMILASFFTGNAFVSFLSSVIPHVVIGTTIVVAILAYFLLMSGFFIIRDRIPNYWIWFHYISLIKYPYEGAVRNEFGDATKCFMRGIQIFDDSMLGEESVEVKERLLEAMSGALGKSITPTTCVMRGVDVLGQQSVTELTKWDCLWITLAWGLFFKILFYFALLIGSKNKRS